MNEVPEHEREISPYSLEPESIEDAVENVLTQAGIWFTIIQPEKTFADFMEFIKPLAHGGKGETVKIVFDAAVPSSQSGLVIRGHLKMVLECCAYCFEAEEAEAEGRQAKAWNHIANAMYRLGRLEGLAMLDPAVTHVAKVRSSKGAMTRAAKYAPIREYARELAVPHQARESKRKTALLIRKAVVAFAEGRGVEMSEYEAERTIIKWLEGMTFATK